VWSSLPLFNQPRKPQSNFSKQILTATLLKETTNLTTKDHRVYINPSPPSDASGKEKLFLTVFSVQHFQNLKNITPLET